MVRRDLCRDAGQPLTREDFRRYPVWSRDETDDANEIFCPVELSDETIDGEEFDAVFILADIQFSDGTRLEGAIFVNPYRERVYGLTLFRADGSFHFQRSLVPKGQSLEQLARWAGKPVKAITPVRYTSPYSYKTGARIRGSLDLHDW